MGRTHRLPERARSGALQRRNRLLDVSGRALAFARQLVRVPPGRATLIGVQVFEQLELRRRDRPRVFLKLRNITLDHRGVRELLGINAVPADNAW
jgi:hypothetical protein